MHIKRCLNELIIGNPKKGGKKRCLGLKQLLTNELYDIVFGTRQLSK